MVNYEDTIALGEIISAIGIKTTFNKLKIDDEINDVKDCLENLSCGSDKIVWTPKEHPDLVLKLAEGTQIKTIPAAFSNIFQPFYEYILPTPIEFRDIIFYRIQIQYLMDLFVGETKGYYPNNNIKNYASPRAIDRQFLWELMSTHKEEFIVDLCKWNMETGISSDNWGFDKSRSPKIFDYGSVRNEKWREISLALDGFFYDLDGIVKNELPI